MEPSPDLVFAELNAGLDCRSYLVGSRAAREAIVIDPLEEKVPAYLEALHLHGLNLAFALDTHTHADHLSGSRALAEAAHGRTAGAPRACVDLPLGEGDVLTLGALRLEVWATPGHTRDSLSLVMADRVIAGDTLLIGATGRTDLPTGDAAQEWESVQRLLALPDETLVFPGHDYVHETHTAIGRERTQNKRILLGREGFIAAMNVPRSSKPALLEQALAFNTRPRR